MRGAVGRKGVEVRLHAVAPLRQLQARRAPAPRSAVGHQRAPQLRHIGRQQHLAVVARAVAPRGRLKVHLHPAPHEARRVAERLLQPAQRHRQPPIVHRQPFGTAREGRRVVADEEVAHRGALRCRRAPHAHAQHAVEARGQPHLVGKQPPHGLLLPGARVVHAHRQRPQAAPPVPLVAHHRAHLAAESVEDSVSCLSHCLFLFLVSHSFAHKIRPSGAKGSLRRALSRGVVLCRAKGPSKC